MLLENMKCERTLKEVEKFNKYMVAKVDNEEAFHVEAILELGPKVEVRRTLFEKCQVSVSSKLISPQHSLNKVFLKEMFVKYVQIGYVLSSYIFD